MEERLIAALEARDSDRLLQLCKEVSTNVTLTISGYASNSLEQSVVHHVACLAQKVACLSELIGRLGPECLTDRNQLGNTVVHCAALCQDDSWMRVILAALGNNKQCFEERGQFRRSVAHFAALNPNSNSALKWLVRECGQECLQAMDEFGDTAVHLAAECQGTDSMELMKRELGVLCFQRRGQWQRTPVHMAAMNEAGNDALKWLVAECGPECLLVADGEGSSSVHLAAWKQAADSLQLAADQLGIGVFRARGFNGWTPVHYAAQNVSSDHALTWCIRELGPACLLDRDTDGATPAHLTAQFKDGGSLRFIAEALGAWAMGLADAKGRTVADYAAQNSKCAGTLESIAALQPLLSGGFKAWDFVLENGSKRSVGENRFVEVYRVLTDKNQTVAVQVVSLATFSDENRLKRAIRHEKRSFEMLKALQHPNIVHFLKCQRAVSEFCIFTELISGQSLTEKLHHRRNAFTEAEVVRFSRQICTALDFLHSHKPAIVHRDINCDNIMVTNEGVIKLIDFGIAKEIFIAVTADKFSETLFRSCYFMAPELFDEAPAAAAAYTPKTDVWAFGCTIYQMMKMRPPNGDLEIPKIPQALLTQEMPDLALAGSPGLSDFYQRCVAKDPGGRADCVELLRHAFLNDFRAVAAAEEHTQAATSCVCLIS